MRIDRLVASGIAVIGLLASCAGSEDSVSSSNQSAVTLSVSLNNMSSTRSTNVTSDPGTTSENTINRVTIGIFASDGSVKTIQETTASSSVASITASSLSTTDSVLVAINAPSGAFTGVSTRTAFHAVEESVDNALADGGTVTETSTNLPMYGSGIVSGSGTSFTSAVSVYHLVAKVTLSSLTVAFSTTGAYANATFTPTEVFLYNVPDNLYFNYSSPWTGSQFYQGESTNTSNYKAYLGTGTFSTTSALSVSGTAAFANTLYFYTMPNTSTTDTRLIIKGNFSADGTSTASSVYYPVSINHASGAAVSGTDKYVYPNRNYKISVTIKGIGATDVSTTLDPETVAATISVTDFTDVAQSNTFD